MKSLIVLFSLALNVILTGCTSNNAVDISKKQVAIVHQKAQGGVDISPVDSDKKLFALDIKSQSQYDTQVSILSEKIKASLINRGWKQVEPSKAKLAVSITIESLEQTVYNQKSSGVMGGVVGGIIGSALTGNINGVLIGGVAGITGEKLFSGNDQDIYWQMNTKVTFRSKDGIDMSKIDATSANTPLEYGDAADQRRYSRMARLEEERLQRMQELEQRIIARNSKRSGKNSNFNQPKEDVADKKTTTDWSDPIVVRFQHSANKANLTLDEALPLLQESFSNTLGGII